MINLQLLIPLLITAIVTICGWYFVHLLAANRTDNKIATELAETRGTNLIELLTDLRRELNSEKIDTPKYLEMDCHH